MHNDLMPYLPRIQGVSTKGATHLHIFAWVSMEIGLGIALNLCEHNKSNNLVISDYYSWFLEVPHLPSTTSTQVIERLKETFASFGIPNPVVMVLGSPALNLRSWQDNWTLGHITSSPHHPQGKSHAERSVQTAKRILFEEDQLIALMSYRSMPCPTTGVRRNS